MREIQHFIFVKDPISHGVYRKSFGERSTFDNGPTGTVNEGDVNTFVVSFKDWFQRLFWHMNIITQISTLVPCVVHMF